MHLVYFSGDCLAPTPRALDLLRTKSEIKLVMFSGYEFAFRPGRPKDDIRKLHDCQWFANHSDV
jgi:hypothetical protein